MQKSLQAPKEYGRAMRTDETLPLGSALINTVAGAGVPTGTLAAAGVVLPSRVRYAHTNSTQNVSGSCFYVP
jgi:hypothetical protein